MEMCVVVFECGVRVWCSRGVFEGSVRGECSSVVFECGVRVWCSRVVFEGSVRGECSSVKRENVNYFTHLYFNYFTHS